MSFGLSAAAIGGIAAGVGAIGSSVISANGAKSAADTQAQATQSGINEQNYEFNTIQRLLKPYVDAGTTALTGYNGATGQYASTLQQLGNLTGANGSSAQSTALQGLTSNPMYTNAMQLGQQSILQNASATGGLRGGNTIASLGYLPSQVLSGVEQQQIGNLSSSLMGAQGLAGLYGQLVSTGQNAAAGTGNAGIQTGNNITSLLGQQGAALASGTVAGANAAAGSFNTILGGSGGQAAIAALMNAGGVSGGGSGGSYGFTMPAGSYGSGIQGGYGIGYGS